MTGRAPGGSNLTKVGLISSWCTQAPLRRRIELAKAQKLGHGPTMGMSGTVGDRW